GHDRGQAAKEVALAIDDDLWTRSGQQLPTTVHSKLPGDFEGRHDHEVQCRDTRQLPSPAHPSPQSQWPAPRTYPHVLPHPRVCPAKDVVVVVVVTHNRLERRHRVRFLTWGKRK